MDSILESISPYPTSRAGVSSLNMDDADQMHDDPLHNDKSKPTLAEEPEVKTEVKMEDALFMEAEPSSKQPRSRCAFDPKPELDGVTDDELRVLAKEAAANCVLGSIKRIRELMGKEAVNFPEWEDMLDRCGKIIDQEGIPRILVGVVGCTGSGKSTLINAVLDEENIVPCSALMAHTSSAVELAWNTSADPEKIYRAEIVFITLQEWKELLDFLLREIRARPDSEKLSENLDSDVGIAYSKIIAVYPKFANLSQKEQAKITTNQLLKLCNLSTVIGRTVHLHASSREALTALVKRYIVSCSASSEDETTYWPLIQAVKIFAKIDILKTGLVLVDLPGLGDSNAGRSSIAESYLKHLRYMWIVENIVRAVDSKIACDLLGPKFQRQLSMDGRYHESFITFVMTWADVLPTESIVEALRLEKSVLKNEAEKEAQTKTSISQVEAQLSRFMQNGTLSKRKRDEDEGTAAKERRNLKKELRKHNKTLGKLNISMKVICREQRNIWAQKRIQQQFKNGLQQMEQELAEGDNDHFRVHTPIAKDTQLNTFCVATNVYQQMCGRMKRENPDPHFYTVKDTNIPDLQNFARKCTFQDRERISDKILTDSMLLLGSIRPWAEGEELTQLSKDQISKLSDEIDNFHRELREATGKIGKNSIKKIRRATTIKIDACLENSVETATAAAKEAAEAIRMAGWFAAQWKAVCRRKGVPYKNFDWVEIFTALFTKLFVAQWKHAFEVKVPDILCQYSFEMILALRKFQHDLAQYSNGICEKYPPLQQLLAQIPILEDLIKQRVAESLEYSEECAKDANREIAPLIKTALQPLYDELLEITGTGMLNKSKDALCKFIKANARGIYTRARGVIKKDLSKMCAALSRKFKFIAENVEQQLYRDLKAMLTRIEDEEEPQQWMEDKKRNLRSTLMTELNDLEVAWAKLVKDPSKDLRAKNPLQRIENIQYIPDGDSEDGSDSESEDEDCD